MLRLDDLQYASQAPYPPVEAEMQNPAYAKVMLDNLGGNHSEMSTISLYIYNNLITGCNPDISKIFHKISVVEMHHLDIFGNLALQLGEDPRMWTHHGCKKIYWSPCCNQYSRDLSALIQNAINGEKATINKYQHQMTYIRDENILANLQRIILDERIHVEIFEQVYADCCN